MERDALPFAVWLISSKQRIILLFLQLRAVVLFYGGAGPGVLRYFRVSRGSSLDVSAVQQCAY